MHEIARVNLLLLALCISIIGCNSRPNTEHSVSEILDAWETENPTSQDEIDAYERPLPIEQIDLHVSSVVWPNKQANTDIRALCQSKGKRQVIKALSEEFLSSRYPRRNRALQLLGVVDDRDWGQHFYPTPSLEKWFVLEGLQ